jgi:hypothetical protein
MTAAALMRQQAVQQQLILRVLTCHLPHMLLGVAMLPLLLVLLALEVRGVLLMTGCWLSCL